MIYVNVEAVKPQGRGVAGGNQWHDTDDVAEAVARGIATHRAMWDALGHGEPVTYRITVAPEASPRRTTGQRGDWPLPVDEEPESTSLPWWRAFWRGFWERWDGLR